MVYAPSITRSQRERFPGRSPADRTAISARRVGELVVCQVRDRQAGPDVHRLMIWRGADSFVRFAG